MVDEEMMRGDWVRWWAEVSSARWVLSWPNAGTENIQINLLEGDEADVMAGETHLHAQNVLKHTHVSVLFTQNQTPAAIF